MKKSNPKMPVKKIFKKPGYLFFIPVLMLVKPVNMKMIVFLAIVGLSLSACDNAAKVEINTDSLSNKLERAVDSVEEKGGRLLDTLNKKWDKETDSSKTDSAR